MDDRFRDAVARFLAAIDTRRGAVRDALVLGAGLTLAAGPEVADAWRGRKRRRRRRRHKRKCPSGATRCGGVCVHTNNDPANCGRCGRECDADETCHNGTCGCDVCADEDACPFQTVQAAVDAAAPGSTITICAGSYDGNVTIDKNLTLAGASEDDTKLKGAGGGSVVTIAAGVTATIRAVTISGGTGSPNGPFIEGGGVFNRGTLTLSDVLVTDNQAERGGGILNFDEVDLTLDHTIVTGNKAVTDGPGATFGGGILNLFSGHLIIQNGSAVVRNSALNSAGIHNNGRLEMMDSLLANNEAEFDGGGLINDEGDVRLNNTVVRENEANKGRGGGILNLGIDLVIENGSEIRGNKAATDGGGIFNEPAGVVTATDSTIVDNTAEENGGGIYNRGGQVTLTNTPVQKNEADNGSGGGVYLTGPGIFGRDATLALVRTTISDNDAGDTGGGVFNTNGGVVTLDAQSAVVDNDPNNCVGTAACPA